MVWASRISVFSTKLCLQNKGGGYCINLSLCVQDFLEASIIMIEISSQLEIRGTPHILGELSFMGVRLCTWVSLSELEMVRSTTRVWDDPWIPANPMLNPLSD